MVRAFDIDGVLADFNTSFIALVEHQTGIKLPPVSDTYPNTWSYHRAGGVNAKQDKALWTFIKESDFWETLQPTKDCAAALARIREIRAEGDHIYFITARPGVYAKHLTEFWLDAQGFECPTVLISSDKGPVCVGLEVEMFVDDRKENCVKVVEATRKVWAMGINGDAYEYPCAVYLLDAPYNRDWTYPGVTRVMSLLDPRLYSEVSDVVAA